MNRTGQVRTKARQSGIASSLYPFCWSSLALEHPVREYNRDSHWAWPCRQLATTAEGTVLDLSRKSLCSSVIQPGDSGSESRRKERGSLDAPLQTLPSAQMATCEYSAALPI
jgi:hypothetical protein